MTCHESNFWKTIAAMNMALQVVLPVPFVTSSAQCSSDCWGWPHHHRHTGRAAGPRTGNSVM